jgi:hypothetical protein
MQSIWVFVKKTKSVDGANANLSLLETRYQRESTSLSVFKWFETDGLIS